MPWSKSDLYHVPNLICTMVQISSVPWSKSHLRHGPNLICIMVQIWSAPWSKSDLYHGPDLILYGSRNCVCYQLLFDKVIVCSIISCTVSIVYNLLSIVHAIQVYKWYIAWWPFVLLSTKMLRRDKEIFIPMRFINVAFIIVQFQLFSTYQLS